MVKYMAWEMRYEKKLVENHHMHKCFECGEIVSNGYYFKISHPKAMDLCEKCGKRRKCE